MSKRPGQEAVHLGNYLSSDERKSLEIWSDEPELQPHLNRAWLRAYAAAQLGADPPASVQARAGSGAAMVPAFALERHTCLFGGTGSGKSRLALHLITQQMRQGCSVVAIDPKAETIDRLMEHARLAGLSPDQVVVLSPADSSAPVPGWNPLLTGLPPAQAAADLVATLAQSTSSWGPRLSDILINALILLAAYRLSLYELPRLLTHTDYRAGLLRSPLPAGTAGGAAYTEAHDFFVHEFSAWSERDQTAAVGPVLNKTRALLGSDFFQAVLCARRNTLDLAALWRKQAAVFVHLDRTALGDDGARLLGGLIAHNLYRTAMRASGPVPVVLALDEMGAQEGFIGRALIDIVTVARSQNLRLLAASQHLAQLSEELRAALLANAGVQVFFRLGFADARPVASSMTIGADEPLRRATAQISNRERETGRARRTLWRHPVLDPHGNSLRLSDYAWSQISQADIAGMPGTALRRVAELAHEEGIFRLYVRAPDTGAPAALSRYLAGVPDSEYWFEGPTPLVLVVSFPACRFVHSARERGGDLSARWTRTLMDLPTQHAVLRLLTGEVGVFRAVDVPDELAPADGSGDTWHREARTSAGHPPKEVARTMAWRRAQVAEVAQGRPPAAVKAARGDGGTSASTRAEAAGKRGGGLKGKASGLQAAATEPRENEPPKIEVPPDDGSLA